jgi:hypothetical protein
MATVAEPGGVHESDLPQAKGDLIWKRLSCGGLILVQIVAEQKLNASGFVQGLVQGGTVLDIKDLLTVERVSSQECTYVLKTVDLIT